MDIDKQREVALHYHVSSIPTIIFFKKDSIFKIKYGFLTDIDLENEIKALLKN